MKLPVEVIKNLLKLVLVGGVAGTTGGWTLHLLNNVRIASDNVQQTQNTSPGGVQSNVRTEGTGNKPNTGRDFDQSTNKTGTVNNFYGGNIDNSLTVIDQSVTTVNNSSTEINNLAITIQEEAQKLSVGNPGAVSSSSVLIQKEAARISHQAATINQTLLQISNRTSAIRKEASTQLLAQEMRSVLQSPATQGSSFEQPQLVQLLSQASPPNSSEESGVFSLFASGSGSGGQSSAEAVPEASPVLGTLLAGFLFGGIAWLKRVKRQK